MTTLRSLPLQSRAWSRSPLPALFLTWAGGHGIAGAGGSHSAVARTVSGRKLHLEAAPAQPASWQLAAAQQGGHTLSQQYSGLRSDLQDTIRPH